MKFKHHYNRNEFPEKFSKTTGPSLTRPDESMTMKEILLRHTRGLPITGAKVPLYEADEDGESMPDLRNLDLAEREDILLAAKQEVEDIKERHRKKVYRDKIIKDKQIKEQAQKETKALNPDNSTDGQS